MGYIIPHFPYSCALLEFLVDHGKPKMVFKLLIPIDMQVAWIATTLTIPFYIILYVYLDSVIPNKWGIA